MELENFTKQEIPYDILDDFGLTKQMIDDLPQSVLQKLLTGRSTPPLPVKSMTQDGEVSNAVTKISLVRKPDGEIDVFFTPRMELLDLDKFPELTAENLKKGTVVRTDKGYAQYNDIIEQVAFVPYGLLLHNLENIQDMVGFSQHDRDQILKGNPVEINEGDYRGCTIGIDLTHENLIRLSKGDNIDWKLEEAVNKMQKYNFGIFGCWVCDDNSVMNYVSEKDYDQHPDLMDAYETMVQQQAKIK